MLSAYWEENILVTISGLSPNICVFMSFSQTKKGLSYYVF